jgi:hypothetical protein
MQNNHLAQALPDHFSAEQIRKWENIFPLKDLLCDTSSTDKTLIIDHAMNQWFLPSPTMLPLADTFSRMITRTCLSPEHASMFVFYGDPGSGKRTSAKMLLSHFPKVIVHDSLPDSGKNYIVQVPVLYAESAQDRSVKGLLQNIQNSLNSSLRLFSRQTPIPNSISLDDALLSNHVNLLVLYLHALPTAPSAIHSILDHLFHFVSIGISVMLIVDRNNRLFLIQSFSEAMTLLSEQQILLPPLTSDSYANMFLEKIWSNLAVDTPPLSESIKKSLLESTCGNRALVIRTMKEIQYRTLILGKTSFTEKELNAALLDVTADLTKFLDPAQSAPPDNSEN